MGASRAKITAWWRWTDFYREFNIDNLDLTFLSTIDRYKTAWSFVAYCRRVRLCKGTAATLGVDSVWKILQDVGETLSLHGLMEGVNPFVNKKLQLRHLIKKMLSLYCLKDPPTRCKSPITPTIIQLICKLAKTPREKFIALLITGDFFYTMHSCKYSTTTSEPKS